ncbi:MAG TPA: protein phosphatase 2C domain-containing protein [Gemmatimonadaceae bacterium]|nr:protein phosphatase 2C domain-containing protein [Gemmatimonadaceae bacterium]
MDAVTASNRTSASGLRPEDHEVDLFGITHQGRVRKENQDHFLVATVHPNIMVHGSSLPDVASLPLKGGRLATILLVADGVGGADDGGTAARVATESVMRYVASSLRSYHAMSGSVSDDESFYSELQDAALKAHDAVRAEAAARGDHARLATTMTLGIVVYPWMYVVQVGDSRAYIHTHGKLQQITRDQTVAQQLVDEGVMKARDLRRSPLNNVLASAIGGDEAMPVVSRVDVSERGCIVLLCSDGLTKHVSDEEIEHACGTAESAERLCRGLVDLALERGGSDNVTVVVGRAPLRRR